MTKNLTQGPITAKLFSMTLSMGVGIISVILFNLADTYFVAKLGKTELVAISLTFPVVNFFFTLALGAAFAVAAVVSKSIGQGDQELVRRYTSDGLTYALLVVIICVILGFIFMKPVFLWLGATNKTLPLVMDYMNIWLAGFVFLTVPMVGNGAIRARGDMKTAAGIMVGSALFNIILDPVLIFGFGPVPAFGIKGAAISTVIARGMTLFLSLGILHYRYQMIDFKRPSLNDAIRSWKKITYIAIPTSATNLLGPLAISVVTAMVARLGETELATYGVVSRIEAFAFVFIFALSSAIGPFIGQNFGAKNYQRLFKSINISIKMLFFWSLICFVILYLFGRGLVGLFGADREMMNLGRVYFTIVPLAYAFYGIRVLASNILSTIGEPIKASYIGILHFVVLFIPAVYYGTSHYHFEGVAFAYFFTYLVIGFFSLFYIKYILSKKLVE